MSKVDTLITKAMRREGWDEYTDHDDDSGGPTKFGITLATLSRYRGEPCTAEDVQALDEAEARRIYLADFWTGPGFADVLPLSRKIAEELFDTGINMGPETAVTFLQRILNTFNNREAYYPDLVLDGQLGPKTMDALRAYLAKRGEQGKRVLLFCLDSQQVVFYMGLAERREKDETFVYGQIYQRAVAAWRH